MLSFMKVSPTTYVLQYISGDFEVVPSFSRAEQLGRRAGVRS
jgi:hypothetical protein